MTKKNNRLEVFIGASWLLKSIFLIFNHFTFFQNALIEMQLMSILINIVDSGQWRCAPLRLPFCCNLTEDQTKSTLFSKSICNLHLSVIFWFVCLFINKTHGWHCVSGLFGSLKSVSATCDKHLARLTKSHEKLFKDDVSHYYADQHFRATWESKRFSPLLKSVN